MLQSGLVNQQIGKRRKKTFKKFVTDKSDSSSIQKKEEVLNASVNKETSIDGCQVPTDLKNFPGLRSYNRHNFNFDKDNKLGTNSQKSWFSVVSNNSNKQNFNRGVLNKELFPELPAKGVTKENKVKLNKQKNEVEQPEASVIIQKNTPNVFKEEVTDMEKKQSSAKGLIKKTSVQPHRNPNKKKRADPIFINLEEVLKVNKAQKRNKQHRVFKSKLQKHREKEHLSGNFLDSSNPVRNKGKHREIKKRKLTNLKLSIIKERIIKQKLREIAVTSHFRNEDVGIIGEIDFKHEIELYLNELSKQKAKKLNESKNIQSDVKGQRDQKKIEVAIKEEKKVEKQKTIPSSDVKGITFSSKLREYCDNIITPGLNSSVSELIKELINLQDRLFGRDPIKARARKRHVSGIKEVKKHLTLKKVKLIVIAPNLEEMKMGGSLYDLIEELKATAKEQNVPYVFALDRYKLGRCTRKNVPVSAFAVLNYEGLEHLFKNVLHYLEEAKNEFAERMKASIKTEEKPDVNSAIISTLISAFQEKLEIQLEN